MNTRFGELRGELKDLMQAEFRAIRAELDHRASRLEQIVRK